VFDSKILAHNSTLQAAHTLLYRQHTSLLYIKKS